MVILMPIGPCIYEHWSGVTYGLYTWINHQSQGMNSFGFMLQLGSRFLWFMVLWEDRDLQ